MTKVMPSERATMTLEAFREAYIKTNEWEDTWIIPFCMTLCQCGITVKDQHIECVECSYEERCCIKKCK